MALYIPETYKDTINEKLHLSLKAASLAKDISGDVPEFAYQSNKIVLPTFSRIDAATAVTKGTAVTPSSLSMTKVEATVQRCAASVAIYQDEENQVTGHAYDSMAIQLGQEIARFIDKKVVDAIKTTSYSSNVTGLTTSAIHSAIENFGDDMVNGDNYTILINSRLKKSFLNLPDFTYLDRSFHNDGNGIMRDGNIFGYWLSIPVVVSDNGTYDSTNSRSLFAILSNDAVVIALKDQVTLDVDHSAVLFKDTLVCSQAFACALALPNECAILNVGE